MKAQIMAQFLAPSDIVLIQGKKFEIRNVKTSNEKTSIVIRKMSKTLMPIDQIVSMNNNEFLTVANNKRFL